jgi:hypothetical protein
MVNAIARGGCSFSIHKNDDGTFAIEVTLLLKPPTDNREDDSVVTIPLQ